MRKSQQFGILGGPIGRRHYRIPLEQFARLPVIALACTIAMTCAVAKADGAGAAESDVNTMCPVLVDREVDPEIATMHQGKEVRFCCNECKQEFLANPELYVNALPQLRELDLKEQLAAYLDTNTRFVVCAALVGLLVLLRVYIWVRPSRKVQAGRWWSRLLRRKMTPTIPLGALCAVLGYEVYSLRVDTYDHWMEDHLHFATFYDFGYPPVPARPPVEPRVQATFYRGNDERSPKLFNNGNYRTATFHLSLVDAEGNTVQHGDQIVGREMFLRLEIDRPPFTADFLYCDRVMSKMFLTKECGKFLGRSGRIADRVDFVEIEPMQRWEARYPLGRICPQCGDLQRGIIYLCEEYYHNPYWWMEKDVRGGSRFHYGIQFELAIDDGRLSQQADLWMGALYRTRKLPKWKVPIEEWFSHEPIPVLTSAHETDDPELLGIDEHESSLRPGSS